MPFSREYLPRETRRMPARRSNMITLASDFYVGDAGERASP